MTVLISISILAVYCQLCFCRLRPLAYWPSDSRSNIRLTHMAYLNDSDQLYIGATNNIYHLRGDSLKVLNRDTTGPFNETTNDEITILCLNKTGSDDTYLTTCSSTRPHCAKRNISDVSIIHDFLSPPILSTNATAFTTVTVKTEWGSRRKIDYTFVACPHSEIPHPSSDLCHTPGLKWRAYDTHKGGIIEKQIGFDSYGDTNTVTEKYIESFALRYFRIFFSIQRNRNTEKVHSRVAQLCHKRHPKSTYVDMIIGCGPYTRLTDIDIHELWNDTLIVTTFMDNLVSGSAVCVFRFSDIKWKLVENIKLCYNGSKVPHSPDYHENYDYILGQTGRCPRGGNVPDEGEEFYLCNALNLQSFFSVIGERSLIQEPVLRNQDFGLTALTVTMVDTELVAFLGTDLGDVRKAVVFPLERARPLDLVILVAYGETINPDMFTDRDKETVYAMTSFKVAKVPVQSCSDYVTCRDCLSSTDPNCGWCIMDHRCSTRISCNASWIAAAPGNSSCLHIDISPDVIPVSESQELQINMSLPLPEFEDVYCLYHLTDGVHGNIVLGNSSATAHGSNWRRFVCMSPDFNPVQRVINGSANVTVSVLSELSSQELVRGSITLYNCPTFRSCSSCKDKTWSCDWCIYDNRCVSEGHSCSNIPSDRLNISQADCPNVIKVEEKPRFMDDKATLYLPVHDSINILIRGRNLTEPRFGLQYTCQIPGAANQTFEANWKNTGQIVCHLNKAYYRLNSGRLDTRLQIKWGDSVIDGNDIPVVLYNCHDLIEQHYDCDKCKSFAHYQPFYHCYWCNNQCVYSNIPCQTTGETTTCPDPSILKVYPTKIHMNSFVRVDITGVNLGSTFNETVDSIRIGNQTCVSLEEFFIPSNRISCELEAPGEESTASLEISIPGRQSGVRYNEPILFKNPTILWIYPKIGPVSGGTLVTLYGEDLDVGRRQGALIGNFSCTFVSISSTTMVFKTTSSGGKRISASVTLVFDGIKNTGENSTFSYVADPVITSIHPRESFSGGGRRLTVTGTNLLAIQKPRLFIRNQYDGRTSNIEHCTRDEDEQVIYCPTPRYPSNLSNSSRIRQRRKREIEAEKESWLIRFKMDNVQSVQKLPENLAGLVYHEDPKVYSLDPDKTYNKVLIIKGERMGVAASQTDVKVETGQESCNITSFTNDTILCKPPPEKPASNQSYDQAVPVVVYIGYLTYPVGTLDYGPQVDNLPKSEERTKEYIIAGTVVGVLALLVVVLVAVVFVIMKKKKVTAKENEKLMHQMENLEASVSKQCREEFAALQTTMSDLTSDLEGGSILFRDYDVYACKVLFTGTSHPVLAAPVIMSDSFVPGMEALKGLLKNKDFLVMFIKTLEQQETFTIQDRSNFASILMAINGDNMEFITDSMKHWESLCGLHAAPTSAHLLVKHWEPLCGLHAAPTSAQLLVKHWKSLCGLHAAPTSAQFIMKTLLNELIDKTVAAQRTKLLLRRSECVVEKLVTHWLSICLYHYLKERTGTALFILYKAIKVQVEKGPLDYITACGKYTLSEQNLFTAADADINAKPLELYVHHFDYKSDKEHNAAIQVLACDTITQTKSKILDVLYNNIPYSQRPLVHGTLLEIKESDGTQRMLNDEDASNEKAGLWKRLNTLEHYKVEDGAKVELTVNREKEMLAVSTSPDAFIVGSIKRSKQVMRTISGSNFWHLTKQHQSDEDEMKLSSDIFLPRLLNTKGTLQTYIDDLFAEMFRVDDEPPLIIKYLFDFLDGAAARHGITDPDVLHTWKCNSLLLRFWVNLVKNPEFVFDIYKPKIVDSCLSVITQTLMDSCSTAALTLGKDSPSNKLLFAKDISRYKNMVQRFFQEIQDKPSVSDQDLNCYLTENVSQKFGDRLYASSALLEIYKYASKYKDKIMAELISMEIPTDATSEQNRDTPLLLKLQQVYSLMEACNTDKNTVRTSESSKTRKTK